MMPNHLKEWALVIQLIDIWKNQLPLWVEEEEERRLWDG